MAIEEHYAAASVWDSRFRTIIAEGEPDRSSQWLEPFLPLLNEHDCRRVFDLGCGTGYDALALARRGFQVDGMDFAQIAIDQARRLADSEGLEIEFRQGDVGMPLPYTDAAFDAVISNLVLHSFDDVVLRRIIDEVDRILPPGGLFLFHANSIEDLERRLTVQPPERQLGPRSYVLAGGQTMHFLRRDTCESLLADWEQLVLEPAASFDPDGNPIKNVWRGAFRKP